MAAFERKEFPGIGTGFTIRTQSIPVTGMLAVMRMAAGTGGSLFRYSLDGGVSFTEWLAVGNEELAKLKTLTDTYDTVLDYVNEPLAAVQSDVLFDGTIYGRSVFSTFFASDDTAVVGWAWNVLEKLFIPGIIPLFVSRGNADDFNTFFLSITHFFAFVVIYGRQFREMEQHPEMLKAFLEGFGIIYTTVDTQEERDELFRKWVEQFTARGTYQVADTGVVNGELRRLVGYDKPSEFMYSVLEACNVGWCVGYSSPTWYGTETVHAVSKGWDWGLDYVRGVKMPEAPLRFNPERVQLGSTTELSKTVQLKTDTPDVEWKLAVGDTSNDNDVAMDDTYAAGVQTVDKYPIVGDLKRKFDTEKEAFVFQTNGTGRCGIEATSAAEAMEIYVGVNYEVTVWVKALGEGEQALDFGVCCYTKDGQQVRQIRLTDLRVTDSFFDGTGKQQQQQQQQSPCLVPGKWYELRGIVFNALKEQDEHLYLNFVNGRPLKFTNDVAYMAPYIVQDMNKAQTPVQIGGVVVKPMQLFSRQQTFNRSLGEVPPVIMPDYPIEAHDWVDGAENQMTTYTSKISQGYLGVPYVVSILSQLNTASTKTEIEAFVKNYLVSYKDVVFFSWLDFLRRSSFYLTFVVRKKFDNTYMEGVLVELNDGRTLMTDEEGFARFEVERGTAVEWKVSKNGVEETGSIPSMDEDMEISVLLDAPIILVLEVYQSGWGTARYDGTLVPGSDVTVTATPADGYVFKRWEIDETEETFIENPLVYPITGYDDPLVMRAVFERNGEFEFNPTRVAIPWQGGTGRTKAISSKRWALDALPEDWAYVLPSEGEAGETEVTVIIGELNNFLVADGSTYEDFEVKNPNTGTDEPFIVK